MCLGSEERGDRLTPTTVRCRRCGAVLPSYSPTFDLCPVHDEPGEPEPEAGFEPERGATK